MNKKIKKLLSKKIILPDPEEVLNKKIALLFLIVLAIFYDIMIIGSDQLFAVQNYDIQTIKTPSLLERNIRKMISGYPMEKMTSYISTKDKSTAAFLVGIAKKESNWGKYSPTLSGKDCYNYWGYRGQSENVTPSGYTCFRNPREAVNVVSERINKLINESKLDTPEKMIVWKCGWDCAGHAPESVEKWITDVDYYYQKFYQ